MLLDAHAINTSKVLPNIRTFNLDIQKAFDFILPIKQDFIKNHLDGFCPVRSKGLDKWLKKMGKVNLKEDIKKDILENKPLLKFSYLKKGANDFLKVLMSKEYHTSQNELKLIKENILKIQSKLNKNIVVLGVGNGLKIKEVLKGLNKDITLVDISEKLINTSKNNLKNHYIKSLITNFDLIDLNKFKDATFIMLGGTLFNNPKWVSFINNIDFKKNNSNMLLGVELLNGMLISKVIKQYDNETGFKFIFNPLKLIGIKRDDGNIKVLFNNNKQRIEEWFVFNNCKRKILLSISFKLKKENFLKKLNKNILFDLKEGNNYLFFFE